MSTQCHYCKLPMLGPVRGRAEDTFCCYGCRVAFELTNASGTAGDARLTLTKLGVAIFLSMNVMVITLVTWSRDIYASSTNTGESSALFEFLQYGSLMLSSGVLAILGMPVISEAWSRLRVGQLATETFVGLGVLAAYLYSVAAVWTGSGSSYFEVVCMVLVAMTIGRWLQANSRANAMDLVQELASLLPQTARRVPRDSDPMTEDVGEDLPLADICVGDTILVREGDRIPLDGEIHQGEAMLDEQIVTGEFQLRLRGIGDRALAGTRCEEGTLRLTVVARHDEGSMKETLDSISSAIAQRTPWQDRADRWATYLLPIVIGISILAFAYHWHSTDLSAGLLSGLAVLLIACPCSLGLAIPLAQTAAILYAARNGIIVCQGEALEKLAHCRMLAIDKTGTLSTGELEVQNVEVDPSVDLSRVLEVALQLTRHSTHTIARAIKKFAQEVISSPISPATHQVEHILGRGIVALSPERYAIGNLSLMEEQSFEMSDALERRGDNESAQGKPRAFVGWSGGVKARFVCHEQLRDDAESVVNQFLDAGWTVDMLTGDHQDAADQIASELGVDVHSDSLPAEKSRWIRQQQRQGKRVLMVGDGVNDAAALAQADVGVAMGCGADLAHRAADICLRTNDLSQVMLLVQVAKAANRTIYANLFWSFSYNAIGIFLALTGRLHPIAAAVAMIGSSIFVTANSLRLLGRPTHDD